MINKIQLVDLSVQHKALKKELNTAVLRVVGSSQFILGQEVSDFEEKFARFCDAGYAVGVDNGVSALELGMRALGIRTDDEVLTPVNSFIASSSSITFTGATPCLVDCDEETFNIDLQDAERRLSKKTRAIMPVHLYGQPAQMEEIKTFAKRHNLFIIEDACQAHGAVYKGRRVGSFGDIAAFSFYPGKNLGAWGDAGCLVTNSKKISQTVSQMRNYGQKEKYHHKFVAWNRRMDTIQAAVLLVKIKYLDRWNKKRQEIAKKYRQRLSGLSIALPVTAPGRTHVYHQFVIRSPKRDLLKEHLAKKGIATGIHYPIPIHLQEAYKSLGYKKGDFPVAEKVSKEILSLPMYPEMTDKQIDYVVEAVKEALS